MRRVFKWFVGLFKPSNYRLEATERLVLWVVGILSAAVFSLAGLKFFTETYRATDTVDSAEKTADLDVAVKTDETSDCATENPDDDAILNRVLREFQLRHGYIDLFRCSEKGVGDGQRSPVLFMTLNPVIPSLADDIINLEAIRHGFEAAKTISKGSTRSPGFIYYRFLKENILRLTVKITMLSERLYEEKLTNGMAESTATESTADRPPDSNQLRMVIIIDDFGYDFKKVVRFEALHPNLVFSVLPLLPYSKKITDRLQDDKRFFILHMPMEPRALLDSGPGALRLSDSAEQTREKMLRALSTMPNVRGVNNHMGSKLTADMAAMDTVFKIFSEKKLFFIDSRTSPNTIAKKLAKKYKVQYAERDVFLDNEQNNAEIQRQFNRALKIIEKKGLAIVIGHPFPETFAVLKTEIPKLEKKNIWVITPGELFKRRNE